MTNCASCVSRRRSDNIFDPIDTTTTTTVLPQNNIVQQSANIDITVGNCNHNTSANVIKSSQDLSTIQPPTASLTNVTTKGSMNFVTRISKIILRKRAPKNSANG
ncbi:unnamed protein product [Didymodactylos carnosus]|uniref:Uncharacterized protein n=1 Tax=Didymodactylos carnosus TaxID=1234261 RepID=A0A813TU71_9BILA|nr:unnamed protein product [Didymodactylos carnosus]CAF1148697.1 unnamed protein product [Didymodactylos carnosus]CAF3604781.1 unnamed protein product [Didymodactylos carnosus]CAF3952639.1 unnamed protein product [Didymodactylos carnosus]